jgi:hypothetical protein
LHNRDRLHHDPCRPASNKLQASTESSASPSARCLRRRKYRARPDSERNSRRSTGNLNLLGEGLNGKAKAKPQERVFALLIKIKHDFGALPENESDDDARHIFANPVPELLAVSICPNYVVNRGHYFGTIFLPEELPLSDTEKRGLLKFIKTYEPKLLFQWPEDRWDMLSSLA